MKVEVERIIDSDSSVYATPSGERLRGRSAHTAGLESTTTTGKQSAKGIAQTARTRTYIRPGDELSIEDDPERGRYGRVLVSPTKVFDGREVDVNHLKSSLGDNMYYTKYGLSEERHDILKPTYSTWLPFQFSDEIPPLSEKEFNTIDEKLPQIQKYIENMKGGENQEQRLFLDKLIGDVFGDDGAIKVSAYLDIKKRRAMKIDRENQPLSPEKLMYDVMKDPRMQEEWDRSVMARTNSDDVRLAWKGKGPGFMEKAGAAMQLYNDMSNYIDRGQLFMSQYTHLAVTDEMLGSVMHGIPPEMRGIVTDEAKKYGNERAFTKAQQLKIDIQSGEIFDEGNGFEKFVYGAGAYLTSLASGTIGLKGVQLATKATKVIRAWETNKVIKALATSGTWAAAAGTESIAMNSPRLLGDATYSPEEMAVDVALETTLGTALPMALLGGSTIVKPYVKMYLADGVLHRARSAEKLERDLTNDITRKTTTDTNEAQLSAGIKRREESRRSDTTGKEDVTTDGQEITSITKGDTPTISSITGGVIEPDVPPIGQRPAIVDKDGTAKPAGEVDAELSVEFGPIDEATQRDWDAESARHLQQDTPPTWEEMSKWTKEERAAWWEPKVTKKTEASEPTEAELAAIKSQEAAEDVVDGGWVESGLAESHTLAKKHIGILGKIGQSIADLTGRAMSHSLQKSQNPVMTFIGHNILEDPSGYAGNIKRHATAALVAVREKTVGKSMILPNYARRLETWSNNKGSAWHETFRAKWGTPDGNDLAKQFEKEFIEAINARKMGRTIDNLDPDIKDMLDDWKKFTDHMGNRALTEKLPGWSKLRSNYFPQIRDNQKMANFAKTYGETGTANLERLFEKGMLSTREIGLHNLDDATIRSLSRKMVKQAETGQKDLPESTSSKLGRAQSRVEMDWSVTQGDLKLSDFLQTDITLTADRYASDLGGRLGLHKATGGKLTTDSDLQGLKDVAYAKHADAMKALQDAGDVKGTAKLDKDFNNEIQMVDDTFNMILGRPPRGGLAPELRHFKDFTTLTRMGILGTSQSIETGNIIARSTMDLFNDPDVLKHMLSMNPRTPEGRGLLNDIMNITGRTKDMEYLHRPSQVLDEESMKSYSGLRQMSIMIADKATGGDIKQPASRLLGKTSMFNWVQRNQSEYTQKSFLIHTDRYFTKGKCSISPKRMVDLGLINRDGTNTELSKVFNEVVKKNEHGHIIDLQWNKWSKKAKEQYMDAAQRDEAQRLQQTFAGEAPAYYNKPLMNLLFQFREVPLVAQNKQLARNLMFADKEAASSIMLNFAIAGMVRYGWLGGLGYAKALVEGETDNYQLPGLDRLDVMRYMASGGMIPDILEIGKSGFQAYNQQDPYQLMRQLPAMGVLKDAKDFALGNNEVNSRAEALQGLFILGTTGYMDVIHTMFVKNIDEMATFKKAEEGE